METEPTINDKKYSFYIDEVIGKYLINYINLLRSDLGAKKNSFSLFKIKKQEQES